MSSIRHYAAKQGERKLNNKREKENNTLKIKSPQEFIQVLVVLFF